MESLCISTQPFSTTCKHHYKIISSGNGKCVAYTPCLKCHVHTKLTLLKRVYVGSGSLICIINLLIASVANVLMRLGRQGKGTEDFSRQWLFSNLELSSWKAILVPGNYSYSDKGQFHVMDITFRDQPFNAPSLSYIEKLFKYLQKENVFK